MGFTMCVQWPADGSIGGSGVAFSVQVLYGEYVSGALYLGDFISMAKAAGFTDPRILASAPIQINDPARKRLLAPTSFQSITARLFKLPEMLEADCEDYGQVAIYQVCTPQRKLKVSRLGFGLSESI